MKACAALKQIAVAGICLSFAAINASAADPGIKATIVVHETSGQAKTYPVQGSGNLTVEQAMQLAGMKYAVTYFPNLNGYAAIQIDGVPKTTNGNLGSPAWYLCINGMSAHAGMSKQEVADGDQVAWYYTKKFQCPKDASQPGN